MKPEQLYKRRIRIEGEYNNVMGYMLRVVDIETGEYISGISKVTIYLDAKHENIAELTYYISLKNGKTTTIRVENPDISITAFERINPDEKPGSF